MKAIVTNHVVEDRMERMMFIAKYIGWGEVIFRTYNAERGHMECITDTGVLLVKSVDERVLVTAYPCGIDKMYAIYARAGMKPPRWMQMRVEKNEKIKKKYHFKG